MWNLPLAVVDAAALHHDPPQGEQRQLTPLAAVHVANVIEHELAEDSDFRVAPVIDTRFLNELGLLQRLPVWRAAVANGSPVESEPEFSSVPEITLTGSLGAQTQKTNQLLGAIAGPRKRGHPLITFPGPPPKRWVYAGVAAILLLLLALWFETRPQLNESVPAYARTTSAPPAATSSAATPETVAAAAPQEATTTQESSPAATPITAPALSLPESQTAPASASQPLRVAEAPATKPPAASVVAVASTPERAPAPASSQPAVANTSSATLALAKSQTPAPRFRLNGIIYNAAHPTAILNGETVAVGSVLNDATVLSITRDHVTLQINGQWKVFELPK
jgi:hypothetical protein